MPAPRPRTGPAHPWLGSIASHLARPLVHLVTRRSGVDRLRSRVGRERVAAVRAKLDRGESVHLVGIGAGGHDAGAALVRASRDDGVELLGNHEEERFRGVKHYPWFPDLAVEALVTQMRRVGLAPSDLDAVAASWDYHACAASAARLLGEEFPWNHWLLRRAASPMMHRDHVVQAFEAPRRLGRALGTGAPVPVLGLRHHDNHAYGAYALSPFAGGDDPDPVAVAVLDGAGDDGAISTYVSTPDGDLAPVHANRSLWDSLGCMYGFLSSSQGGWPLLDSEGRYMGAAAWGDGDRTTNPVYARLRRLFVLGPGGRVEVDRRLANWPRAGNLRPYTKALAAILGPPIPPERLGDPAVALSVDDVARDPAARARADKAAAVQMVFEDALEHVVGHLLRSTGATRLVLAGGVALNGVATMRLLERAGSRLQVWVPPFPNDAGAVAGAAVHLAYRAGARATPRSRLRHAFLCGLPPTEAEIGEAIAADPRIRAAPLGSIHEGDLEAVADTLAFVVAAGGVVGLVQGAAETGPRALGHRSILADPTDAHALARINRRVKRREPFRPLAPMVTAAAARTLFDLHPGAAAADHDAYAYMVLTARARPVARRQIPAVVHRDGTSRIQIVCPDVDPLCHAYLEAMGRRVGVEASVNTSLNVDGPIVQTPAQALEALHRARDLDGLVLVADSGAVHAVWRTAGPGDRAPRLPTWIDASAATRAESVPARPADR